MPDPVLETDPNEDLPEELKGKSPKEIAEYFGARESELQRRLTEATRTQVPKSEAPPADPTATEFWNDPTGTVKKVAVTREEFTRATSMAQTQFVQIARMITRDNHQSDWAKWEPKVLDIIRQMEPWQQAEASNWEAAYQFVKGQNYDTAVNEAERRGRASLSEPPQPPPGPGPKADEPLTNEEQYVATRLGITGKQYRDYQHKMENDQWPLTLSNQR